MHVIDNSANQRTRFVGRGLHAPPWLCVMLLGLTAVGCPPAEPARPRTLSVARPGDALTLDPAAITDIESAQVSMQIFETLVRYRGSTTEVEPGLATSWSVGAAGTEWTFNLRRGVRFHDGARFDADAVVLSFERQRDPAHPFNFGNFAYWKTTFRNIVEVTAVDRYTVRIRIDRPFAPFLASLAMFPASIVSPKAMKRYGRAFASRPVGTGPFRFVRWDKGARIVLARNKHYWGARAQIEQLVYQVISDAGQRLTALESGTVDVAYALAPEDRQIVKLHPDLRLERAPGINVAYLAMHTGRPPFNDRTIRRAVSHAIDKQAIVKLAYQGLAMPARGPLPPSLWGYERHVRTYNYDPAKARAMLEAAGYDFSRRLRLLTMTTPRAYMPSPVLVARMVARYLNDVGMNVQVIARPHGEHIRATERGEHDLCLLGWIGDNGDPDNFLYVLLDQDSAHPGTVQNVAFFVNRRMHTQLIRAQTEMDRGVRERAYRAAQRIVAEEAPWVPLAHTDVVVAHRKEVLGVHVHPSSAVLYGKVHF